MAERLIKSQALVGLFVELAKEKNCYYLNLSNDIVPSEIDGVHYEELAHKKCAELLYEKVKNIF